MAGGGFHSIALKCVMRTVAIHGVSSADCHKLMVAPRIATVKSLNSRPDCHRPELAAANPCYLSVELGNPQYTGERFAKRLFRMWQTAVFI
jgi:hypothetical protein